VTKIAIVAGEASGDLIAAQLMLNINRNIKNVQYIGVGGPMMKKNGLSSFFDYKVLGVNGYIEVLKNLFVLLRRRRSLIKYLLNEKPDIFIGIDAPDFNFKIEKTLKENNIKVVHYVAPSVWAWRKKRIRSIKSFMNHLFLVFPHEIKIFKSVNMPATYVGHPLATIIPYNSKPSVSRKKLNIEENSLVIAILPGSRLGEIRWHLDTMLEAAVLIQKELDSVLFVIPCNNKDSLKIIDYKLKHYKQVLNIKTVIGHSHDVINSANIVIVASGTASLESALFKKPMLIIFKTSWLSFQILSRMKLIPWIGLPNILLNKLISPEFVQNDAIPSKISKEAIRIINDKSYKNFITKEFNALHKSLRLDTSGLIFNVIKKYLR